MGKFLLTYQKGKGAKIVPVLIPNDIMPAIRKMVEIRDEAGVALQENPYRITATKMRHHASTLYALLDIPEQERQSFYRHMGHSREINQHVYQCHLGVQELTKVGRFLNTIDKGTSKKFLCIEHYN